MIVSTEVLDQEVVEQFEESGKLTLPDMEDEGQVNTFNVTVYQRAEEKQRGYPSLWKAWKGYLNASRLLEVHKAQLNTSIATVNGETTAARKLGYRKRDIGQTAKAYYESLSTQGLRMQCNLFDIDYNAFDSQEEIIDALVQATLSAEL